jgi:hypothetical protein
MPAGLATLTVLADVPVLPVVAVLPVLAGVAALTAAGVLAGAAADAGAHAASRLVAASPAAASPAADSPPARVRRSSWRVETMFMERSRFLWARPQRASAESHAQRSARVTGDFLVHFRLSAAR